MHKECIAPQGARLGPCNFNIKPETAYAGCHRYDQSALNVILIREFGSSPVLKVQEKNSIVRIARKHTPVSANWGGGDKTVVTAVRIDMKNCPELS